jgi:hypothetical protein
LLPSAAVAPVLKLTLVNGDTEEVLLAENADSNDQLRRFVEKQYPFADPWVRVADDRYVQRSAVARVEFSERGRPSVSVLG